MQRGSLRVIVFLLAQWPCVQALAHGVPPDAYAVLSHDTAGVRAVSFSAGLALRRSAGRYQFVCPAAWGDQFPAPVAALADGGIVVGASSGLVLLAEDGSLRPHPDAAAVGRSSHVVRSARGVFALRETAVGSEVLAVDALQARVLWKDPKPLYSMAAADDKLVLLRESARALEQVTIATADGAVLDRQVGVVELPVDYVFARADAGAAYAYVMFRNATVALGALRMNTFVKLADAELSIAGPLSLAGGTLLALDGKLSQLTGGQTTPLADTHNVVCLAQHEGLGYACDTAGISRVVGQTLAEPLFQFSWLAPPDLERVPAGDARMLCSMQWSDLRLDLQLIGVTPLEDGMPVAGASTATPIAGSAAPAPSLAVAGGGGAAGTVPSQQPQAKGSSCATVPGQARGTAHACTLAFLLALARLQRRRDQILGRSRRAIAQRLAGARKSQHSLWRFLTGF